MGFRDGAVHPRGESKIVSIDDEPPHLVSLTKSLYHRGHGRNAEGRLSQKKQRKWLGYKNQGKEHLLNALCGLCGNRLYAVFAAGRGSRSPRNISIFSSRAGNRSSLARQAETSF